MITIKDIAKVAGVSYATVSRALNGRKDVNPETRAYILKIANDLHYQPNMIARSLVKQQSSLIALIVPDVSNPYFADIARAVNEAALKKGYSTMICNSGWDSTRETEWLHLMEEQRVEGVIIKPSTFINPATFDQFRLPLVILWHPEQTKQHYVEIDHRKGAALAVEHLIKRGFRRIAYLGGKGTSPANQIRQETWRETLHRHHLPIYKELLSEGGFDARSGYERVGEMMSNSPSLRPDAVFCGNDYIALGALQYANEHQLKVPHEFGIVGYDDIYFASLPMINLTTVQQPRDILGQKAFELLESHFAEDRNDYSAKMSLIQEPSHHEMEVGLSHRGSSSAKKTDEREQPHSILVEPVLKVRGT